MLALQEQRRTLSGNKSLQANRTHILFFDFVRRLIAVGFRVASV